MKPRVLVISPHPDDETFFMGGTLATYARVAEVRLLVVGDGENGKRAAQGNGAPSRPAADRREAFVDVRRRQCRAAARELGIADLEFLGFRDWSWPGRLVSLLRSRVNAFDPHVVLSMSEAGTTGHPQHSLTAIATFLAIRSLLRRAYGDRADGAELPAVPPFALRRYFTYTLPVAAERFDYWAELVVPSDQLTRIDVRAALDVKRRAARAHLTQAHWVDYLERVGVLELPCESFVERFCIGESARGTAGLLEGIGRPGLRLSLSAPPLPLEAYSSSVPGFHGELVGRVAAAQAEAIRAVVLASGRGTRMLDPGVPKSLQRIAGTPLIQHIVRALQDAGVDDRPAIVVGPGGDRIREQLGPTFAYVEQDEPVGTGHALACCRGLLAGQDAPHVMVLYGDKPLVSADTVRALALRHVHGGSAITLGTVPLREFAGWRTHLRHAGRIVRASNGRVSRIAEYADASEEERKIAEINGGLYCFRGDWLWRNIHRLERQNRQNEYYLTDLVAMARRDGEAIATLDVRPEEAVGVNTREDLATAEALLAGSSTGPGAWGPGPWPIRRTPRTFSARR